MSCLSLVLLLMLLLPGAASPRELVPKIKARTKWLFIPQREEESEREREKGETGQKKREGGVGVKDEENRGPVGRYQYYHYCYHYHYGVLLRSIILCST